MRKSIGYGLIAIMLLSVIATISFAQVKTYYDPIAHRNKNINTLFDRTTGELKVNELKALLGSPGFTKWTNMEGLRKYLKDRGYDLDELRKQANALDTRELLSYSGRKATVKTFNPGQFFGTGLNMGEKAITDIDCDESDRELEFELTNTGRNDWFLIYQHLTEGQGKGTGIEGQEMVKELSDEMIEAKQVRLFINGFPVNDLVPRFWMGEKLFFPFGETFADACRADFVRKGKSVSCEVEPIPARGGFVQNDYVLITPHFTERGTFNCD